MAFESVNYQCPACGGPLHFASAEQKLVCDYCDSRFEVEEVETLYRERQDKADAKADAAAVAPKPAVDDAVQELAQNAGYICSSCGAELISDGTVAVTTCPWINEEGVRAGVGVYMPWEDVHFGYVHRRAQVSGMFLLSQPLETAGRHGEQAVYCLSLPDTSTLLLAYLTYCPYAEKGISV